ncbi:MAG: hypothetical protein V2B15_05605 [Bacteroidota bacterium]
MIKKFVLIVPGIFLLLGLQVTAQDLQTTEGWFGFRSGEDFSESVIDASGWLDAPAGKHGFLQMEGGSFRFEDGTPVKFWGVNICSQRPYSEKEVVDRWVQQLAKYGINGVRFHKFSGHACEGNSSTVPDEELYRKFDYFSTELRKKGIYYGWSHIYGHRVKPDDREKLLNYEEIAGLDYPWSWLNGTTSSLVNFAPDLQDLSIELTMNMLNRVNTQTGVRYAEDPALAFIELQNEDDIFWGAIGESLKQAPTYRNLLYRQFSGWLKEKYGTDEDLISSWGREYLPGDQSLEKENIDPTPSHSLFSNEYRLAMKQGSVMPRHILDKMRFLYETQAAFYERFTDSIRATGYKGLIVGSCWQAGMGPSHYYNLHADYRAGFIDRHNYWGGGTGHSMEAGRVKSRAMVSSPGSGLLSTGMQQVADRPFSLSEWMALIPNEWVAEGVPVIALYGMGLQGWDASFQFASDYPEFSETIHTPGVYNVTSPTQLTLYPAISRMIYRNDIKEGEVISSRYIHIPSLSEGKLLFNEKVEQGYDDKFITGDVPSEALAAGRVVVEFPGQYMETPVPDLSALWDRDAKMINSNTGQLHWDYSEKGFITANSPAFKAVVGFAGGETHDLGDVSVELETPFAVVLVTALEKDRTIADSEHILVTTVARARNTGMQYSENGRELLDVGGPPILLEPVRLKLAMHREGRPVVHLLDHVGRRTGKTIPVTDGVIVLDGAESRTIYYELEYGK